MSWFFVFFIISTERFNKKLDNRRRLVYTNFWVMGMILINIIIKHFIEILFTSRNAVLAPVPDARAI